MEIKLYKSHPKPYFYETFLYASKLSKRCQSRSAQNQCSLFKGVVLQLWKLSWHSMPICLISQLTGKLNHVADLTKPMHVQVAISCAAKGWVHNLHGVSHSFFHKPNLGEKKFKIKIFIEISGHQAFKWQCTESLFSFMGLPMFPFHLVMLGLWAPWQIHDRFLSKPCALQRLLSTTCYWLVSKCSLP